MSFTGAQSAPRYKKRLPGLGRGRMEGWGCMGAWLGLTWSSYALVDKKRAVGPPGPTDDAGVRM